MLCTYTNRTLQRTPWKPRELPQAFTEEKYARRSTLNTINRSTTNWGLLASAWSVCYRWSPSNSIVQKTIFPPLTFFKFCTSTTVTSTTNDKAMSDLHSRTSWSPVPSSKAFGVLFETFSCQITCSTLRIKHQGWPVLKQGFETIR